MVPGSLGCGSAVLPVITTLAPSRAQRKAISRPMPRDEPVMKMVLSCSVVCFTAFPSLAPDATRSASGLQLRRREVVHHDDLAPQGVIALQLQRLLGVDDALFTRLGDLLQFFVCPDLAALARLFQFGLQRFARQRAGERRFQCT